MNEFKGETKEAIQTLKSDMSYVKEKMETMDRKMWLVIILLVVALAVKAPDFSSALVGKIVAFGR